MTYAIREGTNWRELAYGQPILIGDVATSYASMLAWSPQYRTARDIKPIDVDEVPEGKVATGEPRLEDRDGRPVRFWDLEDAPVYHPTSEDVNTEASRRIAAGFEFQGKMYDYDDRAQKRITGAATLAGFAAGAGAPAGFLHWHGGGDPFAWIAMDNSLTEMDAPTCFAFGQAAAAWESAHVFAGRALKDMHPIPADFASDQYWP